LTVVAAVVVVMVAGCLGAAAAATVRVDGSHDLVGERLFLAVGI
jgi:hypothetical protein